MASSLRVLGQIASAKCSTPPSAASLRPFASFSHAHIPRRRNLHGVISQANTSSHGTSAPQNPPQMQDEPVQLGHAFEDHPSLVRIRRLPHQTTEEDVKCLLQKAGFPDAEVSMLYSIETGRNSRTCFAKMTHKEQVPIAVTALSRFTLFGLEFTPEAFASREHGPGFRPSLYTGWRPSPSSDPESRIFRPYVMKPPELLRPLLAEQWVEFYGLPLGKDSDDEDRYRVLIEFYKMFHHFEVVGIGSFRVKLSNHRRGCYCRIQFGSREMAKAARKLYVDAGTFMGKKAQAKIFRSGPNIHQLLWKYQQSLPDTLSESENSVLLENKYKELIAEDIRSAQRGEYPTPESAVGLKC